MAVAVAVAGPGTAAALSSGDVDGFFPAMDVGLARGLEVSGRSST
ncbi:hypothetical protein [Streptomyces adustus]